jgi:uncharacterized delta-60 repeat protein
MHLPRHPAAVAASMLAAGALGTGVAFAAAAGGQDPDFNGGAPALLDFPGTPTSAVMALTLAPDGSIFTGAGSYGGAPLALAHLSASGAPVAGFGTDGLVTDGTIVGLASPPQALAVAADGDLLVGVNTLATQATLDFAATLAEGDWGTGDETVQGEFTVERYDASGIRVGESRVDIDPANDDNYSQARIAAILPQADGTTLLLGSASIGAGDERRTRFVRVLLGADGAPVTSFGDNGVAIDPAAGLDAVADVGGHQAGGPDGSFVIAGDDGHDLVLRRYLADGSVDASYGGTFPHEVIQGTSSTTAALAPDGSLYVFITFGHQLLRFTAAGQPDTSFSTSGVDAPSSIAFERIAVEPGGKLLVAGRRAGTGEVVVARLNGDGTLDTAYGDGGIRTLPLSDGLTVMTPRALAVQPDGKAVVGGDGRDTSRTETGETPPELQARAVALEPGESVGFVARLSGDPEPPVTTPTDTTTTGTTTTTTTQTQTQDTTTTTTAAPAAKPVAAASANPLPVAKSCVSRRSFKIHLRIPRGDIATSATVKVDGKQVKVVKGSRLRAAIDLRGLPKGKATISIVVKLAGGKKPLTGTRVYRTCVPKRTGSVPHL